MLCLNLVLIIYMDTSYVFGNETYFLIEKSVEILQIMYMLLFI